MNPLDYVTPWFQRSLNASLMGCICLGPPMVAMGADSVASDSDTLSHAPIMSFAPIVKRDGPSVVTISTTRTVKMPRRWPPGMDEQLRKFFENQGGGGYGMLPGMGQGGDDQGNNSNSEDIPEEHEKALGSGVIVSSDGYILTNDHVVDNADGIEVSFDKGRERYAATLVGKDPKSDLAVLKISTGKTLPAIVFGNSAKAEVGDIVLAIGNPFGVGQSVTMGIISARGRDINLGGQDSYEDFLQTDASINPGNSGGALVDVNGKLIGINTAILSPSGGNLGIGFAIPVNQAQLVMDGIINKHHVARSFLGIMISDLTPQLAKVLQVPNGNGVVVEQVLDGPAAKAGVKGEDVVMTFNGTPVESPHQLRLLTSQTPPGTKVVLGLVRDGKPMNISVILEEIADKDGTGNHWVTHDALVHGKLGVQIRDLTDGLKDRMGVPQEITGALIIKVEPGSAADKAGIKSGDIIMEIQKKSVESARKASKMIDEAPSDFDMKVWNKDQGEHYVAVSMVESK